MIKKIFIIICLGILLVLSCYYFITTNYMEPKKPTIDTKAKDVIDKKQINKKELTIAYFQGNMIDEELQYGNKITKLLKVTNNNKETVAFSLKFKESYISNKDVTYTISFSNDGEKYEKLSLDKDSLIEDQTLYYNLAVNPESAIFFKVEILSNNTLSNTIVKGIISVETNLTDKELFVEDFKIIKDAVVKKVQSVNGIETKGIYTLNITSVPLNDLNSSYRGIVIIDATDYSFIKYIYNIYSDKVMLLDFDSDNELKSSNIKSYNKSEADKINEVNLCTSYTKKECTLFGTLKKSNKRTTASFTEMVNDILKQAKEKISNMNLNQSGYVYDIQKITDKYKDIKGFIIVDNTNNKKDIYINITDNFYTILGYNYSKYGDVKERSGTLRMYVEFTYNQSSETKQKACTLIGLSKCLEG